MKAYVINLKRSTERLAQFREQEFPFDVELFEALEGDTNEHRDWACSLSHIEVIKKITEFPTIVFEDDCIMLQPWSFVEEAMKQLPSDWDSLWLGPNLQKPVQQYSENLYRLHSGHASHATIYNSQRMIDACVAMYNTKDFRCFDAMCAYHIQPKFNCYCIYPIAATQRSCISDINECFLDNYNVIVDSYKKNIIR
jgi:GR25 family glycosyltransferase involved in LPS biosynthesis